MKEATVSSAKKSPGLQRHNRVVSLAFLISLLIYALVILLGKEQGHGAIGAFFPVLAAAMRWGWKGGLIAGLCAFPANMLTLTLVGLDWRISMTTHIGIGGHIFFIIQGFIVGAIQDLYLKGKATEKRLWEEVQERAAAFERIQSTERQLNAVLEQSADGIYITEHKTRTILMANQAFITMVDIPREQLIGNDPWCFVPEVGRTYSTTLGDEISIDMQYYVDNYTILQKLTTEGKIRDWEYYIVGPGNKLVPVEANVTTLVDEQGQRIGAISVVRDITGRKKAERELREANDFLNNIIKNSIDCIIISDNRGRITNINQAGLELLGYTRGEIIGKSTMELFSMQEGQYETAAGDSIWLSTQEIEAIYGRMAEFFDTGRLSNYASYLIHNDGRLVEVEHNMNLLYDQQGEIIGSVGITRDRSMRCRMERELSKQADLLSQANRELESFAYSVSHDLRAPLRSINGFSTALAEDFEADLPDEAREYLQRIRKAAIRMDRLIDDILNLSRISRHGIQREQIDMSALAEKAVAHLREQTPERNVTCTIESGITVRADSHLLRIMLENLLANAWKYTGQQAASAISFSRADDDNHRPAECEPDAAVFCVRDNGVGFDMNYAGKLFKPFQRLHAEKDFPGTGIGLATVQRIIRRHGGHIWAHSAPGKGAAFYFTL